MPSPHPSMLVAWLATTTAAMAGDWTIGLEASFDRLPDDISEPKATKLQVNGSSKLPNGIAIGGSFQAQINTGSGEVGYNLEGTLGYAWKLDDILSIGGSAGVGGKFQEESAGGDFPYYVLRIHADIALGERWSWNMITYRFRDAFNPDIDYYTPEVSSALTFKIDGSNSLLAKYYFGWKNDNPDYQGIGFGYRHTF